MNWNDIWSGKIKLKINDRVFVYGHKNISELIRVFEGLLDLRVDGQVSIANHVGCISKFEDDTIYMLEAVWPRFSENLLSKYDDGETEMLIMRDVTINDLQCQQVVAYIRREFKGKLYNVVAIGTQLFDNVVSFIRRKKTIILSKLNWLKLPICSRALAIADSEVLGHNYDVHPAAASPDDMLDYILRKPKKYKIIFATDKMLKMVWHQVDNKVIKVNGNVKVSI